MLNTATAAYKAWSNQRETPKPSEDEQDVVNEGQQGQEVIIHEMEQLAIEGLKNQINQKNPYEFQELIAALLRGMGYYTPFVAPKGKDGGVDVIAYRDPLGTVSPRMKVQIKHREVSATVQEIRQLMGIAPNQWRCRYFCILRWFYTRCKINGKKFTRPRRAYRPRSIHQSMARFLSETVR